MNKAMAATNWSASGDDAREQEARGYVHPTAILDPSVQLGEGVMIHANVVVERGVKIASRTILHTGCYIGEDCLIGEDSILQQFVTLREKTHVGSRVNIGAGVVIGSDGFGYAKEQNGINFKVPQVGYVIIEDEVKIGPNTTIDRATLGSTVIKKGARIGSLVQVGHNVNIGEMSVIGSSVGICGSCKIGNEVKIGDGVGMVGHIRIGDSAQVISGAGISKDVPDQASIMGAPAMEIEQYNYYQSFLTQLPELNSRLNALEKKLKEEKGEE